MHYLFKNENSQMLFCFVHGCIWYCRIGKDYNIFQNERFLINRIKNIISNKSYYSSFQMKNCYFKKIATGASEDFDVIFSCDSYYLCYKSFDHRIFYLSNSEQEPANQLISTDNSSFFHPRNLKLALQDKLCYLFSIQTVHRAENDFNCVCHTFTQNNFLCPNRESLIFLPLTPSGTPTLLLDINTTCSEYSVFTAAAFIYLIFPCMDRTEKCDNSKEESPDIYYNLNLYSFHPVENVWSYERTLIHSEYSFENFDCFFDQSALHIAYTINCFGIRFLFYDSYVLISDSEQNGDSSILCYTDQCTLSEFIYKTGMPVRPALSMEQNILRISWYEDSRFHSLAKSPSEDYFSETISDTL